MNIRYSSSTYGAWGIFLDPDILLADNKFYYTFLAPDILLADNKFYYIFLAPDILLADNKRYYTFLAPDSPPNPGGNLGYFNFYTWFKQQTHWIYSSGTVGAWGITNIQVNII